MIVKMPYSEAGVNTSTVSAAGDGYYITKEFNANSLFDPDETGIGGQPMWRDQWAGIYGRYFVRKFTIQARIHVTALNNASGGYIFVENYDAGKGAVLNPDADTIAAMLERVKTPTVNGRVVRFSSPAGGGTIWRTIYQKCVPAFELKGYDVQTANSAAFGANPAREVRTAIHFVFAQAASAASFWIEYRTQYEVILMEPKEVDRS